MNDLTETFKTLFCDMDGVLVDWNRGYKEAVLKYYPQYLTKYGIKERDFMEMSPHDFEHKYLFNHYLKQFEMNHKKAKNAAKGAFWKPVQGSLSFWTGLEWMPDGKELLTYLLDLKNSKKIEYLNILSAPSSDKVCEVGKRQWLKDKGISHIFDEIIIESNKSQFAKGNPNNILVDDTPKKIDGWRDAGGTPVMHKSTKETIEILNNIFKG